ncbi:MAG: hypothetical protein AAF081_02795 [Actinomycetota bacterium]
MAPHTEQETPNLSGPERVVVAPAAGVFEPATTPVGAIIRRGQIIGHVRCGTERVQITSPFDGRAHGSFAWPDERVRRYQPVMWMTGNAA